jgi:uncharacterized protein (DUF2147 family)
MHRFLIARFLIALCGLALALATGSAAGKSNLEGRWKNGAMEILIAPCGPSLCGKVVRASERQRAKAQSGSGTRLLGSRVIDNIRPSGPRRWSADVFVASRNMNARGTIEQVGPNRLTVRGCVLAVICKTTHWDRIS